MKTLLLILGVIFLGLGVRGLIVGFVHGTSGSFLVYKEMPNSMELYANILFIVISLVLLSIAKSRKRA